MGLAHGDHERDPGLVVVQNHQARQEPPPNKTASLRGCLPMRRRIGKQQQTNNMKIETSKLTGPALDWAVAKCEPAGLEFRVGFSGEPLLVDEHDFGNRFIPSTDWAQGGPIIYRERISLEIHELGDTRAYFDKMRLAFDGRSRHYHHQHGDAPLIAAMRCYVASKLGDEVEVPDELT